MDQTTSRICPWCSTEIPAGASACPKCRALVEGAVAKDIPGLTIIDPEAKLGLPDEGRIPDAIDPSSWLSAGKNGPEGNPEAWLPPSPEVRREMAKIALETQIENAGSVVLSADGDEAIEVGAPSDEAIAAEMAGLLDEKGPAGEEDLAALADVWEDPELEQRVQAWRQGGDPTDAPGQ
jgi:hypothetical protein